MIHFPSAIFYSLHLSSFERFYAEAEKRNQLMVGNLLQAMDRADARVAVVVTGGFHAFGMSKLLSERNITTVSFVPRITTLGNGSPTENLGIFTQQKAPLETLFQGEKLFLAPLIEGKLDRLPFHLVAIEMLLSPFQRAADVLKRLSLKRRVRIDAVVRAGHVLETISTKRGTVHADYTINDQGKILNVLYSRPVQEIWFPAMFLVVKWIFPISPLVCIAVISVWSLTFTLYWHENRENGRLKWDRVFVRWIGSMLILASGSAIVESGDALKFLLGSLGVSTLVHAIWNRLIFFGHPEYHLSIAPRSPEKIHVPAALGVASKKAGRELDLVLRSSAFQNKMEIHDPKALSQQDRLAVAYYLLRVNGGSASSRPFFLFHSQLVEALQAYELERLQKRLAPVDYRTVKGAAKVKEDGRATQSRLDFMAQFYSVLNKPRSVDDEVAQWMEPEEDQSMLERKFDWISLPNGARLRIKLLSFEKPVLTAAEQAEQKALWRLHGKMIPGGELERTPIEKLQALRTKVDNALAVIRNKGAAYKKLTAAAQLTMLAQLMDSWGIDHAVVGIPTPELKVWKKRAIKHLEGRIKKIAEEKDKSRFVELAGELRDLLLRFRELDVSNAWGLSPEKEEKIAAFLETRYLRLERESAVEAFLDMKSVTERILSDFVEDMKLNGNKVKVTALSNLLGLPVIDAYGRADQTELERFIFLLSKLLDNPVSKATLSSQNVLAVALIGLLRQSKELLRVLEKPAGWSFYGAASPLWMMEDDGAPATIAFPSPKKYVDTPAPRRPWRKWIAAAVVLILISIPGWSMLQRASLKTSRQPIQIVPPVVVNNQPQAPLPVQRVITPAIPPEAAARPSVVTVARVPKVQLLSAHSPAALSKLWDTMRKESAHFALLEVDSTNLNVVSRYTADKLPQDLHYYWKDGADRWEQYDPRQFPDRVPQKITTQAGNVLIGLQSVDLRPAALKFHAGLAQTETLGAWSTDMSAAEKNQLNPETMNESLVQNRKLNPLLEPAFMISQNQLGELEVYPTYLDSFRAMKAAGVQNENIILLLYGSFENGMTQGTQFPGAGRMWYINDDPMFAGLYRSYLWSHKLKQLLPDPQWLTPALDHPNVLTQQELKQRTSDVEKFFRHHQGQLRWGLELKQPDGKEVRLIYVRVRLNAPDGPEARCPLLLEKDKFDQLESGTMAVQLADRSRIVQSLYGYRINRKTNEVTKVYPTPMDVVAD